MAAVQTNSITMHKALTAAARPFAPAMAGEGQLCAAVEHAAGPAQPELGDVAAALALPTTRILAGAQLGPDLDGAELAHMVGTNQQRLIRIFREQVGMSADEHLLQLRLERGRGLLHDTGL